MSAAVKKSTSQHIRELHASGSSRSEISKKLKIRYQFVRNVLVNDENKVRLQRLASLEESEATVTNDDDGGDQ